LSPSLVKMMMEAWTIGSIDFGARQIRSGFTILALTGNDELYRMMQEVSREFQKITPEDLRKNFLQVVAASRESAAAQSADDTRPGGPRTDGKTPYLDQYTVNVTENARQGKIDPVFARDAEIRQIIDILTR